MNRRHRLLAAFSLVALLTAGAAVAQDVMIYPAQNQPPEQQEKDKFECYSWAKVESAFDPMLQPTATEPPPEQQSTRGGVLRGAAVGAVVGNIAGGDSSDRRTARRAGAAIGGIRQRNTKRQNEQAQQQWEQDQQRIYQENRNTYNRAYGACLTGRGYSVS
jgi:hypothetical protein